jgi:FkbM family methyltransferase
LINRYNCNVFTFDPTPRAKQHYDILRQNTDRGVRTLINNDSRLAYDCTVGTLQHLQFYPYGLWTENTRLRFYVPQNSAHVSHSIVNLQKTQSYFEADCQTVGKLMQEFNHETIALLKLDVEGAEYHVIDSLLADAIYPTVLCIEFDEGHTPQDSNYLQRIIGAISKLKQVGYLATYVDSWNVTFLQQQVLRR